MKKPFLALLGGTAILLIAACAPDYQKICSSSQDSYSYGYSAGASGRSSSAGIKLASECRPYGKTIDLEEFERGRIEGLKTFCTPKRFYEAGKHERPLSRQCELTPDLVQAYNQGLDYAELRERLEKLERERKRLLFLQQQQ